MLHFVLFSTLVTYKPPGLFREFNLRERDETRQISVSKDPCWRGKRFSRRGVIGVRNCELDWDLFTPNFFTYRYDVSCGMLGGLFSQGDLLNAALMAYCHEFDHHKIVPDQGQGCGISIIRSSSGGLPLSKQ